MGIIAAVPTVGVKALRTDTIQEISRNRGRQIEALLDTGPATQPYSATEVDGWKRLSRVSQNRAAVHR